MIKKKKSYQLICGLIYNNEIIEKNLIQKNPKSQKDPNSNVVNNS